MSEYMGRDSIPPSLPDIPEPRMSTLANNTIQYYAERATTLRHLIDHLHSKHDELQVELDKLESHECIDGFEIEPHLARKAYVGAKLAAYREILEEVGE